MKGALGGVPALADAQLVRAEDGEPLLIVPAQAFIRVEIYLQYSQKSRIQDVSSEPLCCRNLDSCSDSKEGKAARVSGSNPKKLVPFFAESALLLS